jgi:hypothetical protein
MRGYALAGFGLLVVGLAMAGVPAVAVGLDAEPATRPDDRTGERQTAQQAQAGPSKPDNLAEFYISNIETVYNCPRNPTIWTTREPVLVTYVRTYHWNNAQGAAPGKISLRHEDGTVYGPWQTTGTDGMGGVKNACWVAEPAAMVKPGTYTVVDSDPATWAQNAQSEQRGFVNIRFRRFADALAALVPTAMRVAGADRVLATDGSVLIGAMENQSFAAASSFGKVEIAARDLAGIVPIEGDPNRAWLLLADGQAIRGELGEAVLRIKVAAGSTLSIPIQKVRECGLRLPDDKQPTRTETATTATAPADPMMVILRSGERLACTDLKEDLGVEAPYGRVTVPARAMLRIEPNYVSPDRPPDYRLVLRNGSRFSGKLLQEKLSVKLRLGPAAAISRQQLVSLTRAGKAAERAGQAAILMRNGDTLIGEIADKSLTVRTRDRDVTFAPPSASSIRFDQAGGAGGSRVSVRLWDGSDLSGELVEPDVAFSAGPDGPTLKLPAAQVVSVIRSCALPPAEIMEQARKLIAQLGAESYKDRQDATEALVKIGPAIIPLLEKHLDAADPEVLSRLREILERLRPQAKEEPTPRNLR